MTKLAIQQLSRLRMSFDLQTAGRDGIDSLPQWLSKRRAAFTDGLLRLRFNVWTSDMYSYRVNNYQHRPVWIQLGFHGITKRSRAQWSPASVRRICDTIANRENPVGHERSTLSHGWPIHLPWHRAEHGTGICDPSTFAGIPISFAIEQAKLATMLTMVFSKTQTFLLFAPQHGCEYDL